MKKVLCEDIIILEGIQFENRCLVMRSKKGLLEKVKIHLKERHIQWRIFGGNRGGGALLNNFELEGAWHLCISNGN